MKIALASCTSLPHWEVDDLPLHASLRRYGVDVSQPAWTQKKLDWSEFDAVLIRTTWDYAERRREFVDWARQVSAATRLFNSARAVEWNSCKSYLNDLAAAGVATIPTETLSAGSHPSLRHIMTTRGWSRGFLKPRIGATARATLRFTLSPDSLESARAHLARYLPTETMLLQPYLERVESDGEGSAIVIDGELTHAVRKLPRPGDYRVQDDFGASDRLHDLSPAEENLVKQTLAALENHPEWTGSEPHQPLLYARVDFLQSGGDILLNELEVVEPSLFFRHCPAAADQLARAVVQRCQPVN